MFFLRHHLKRRIQIPWIIFIKGKGAFSRTKKKNILKIRKIIRSKVCIIFQKKVQKKNANRANLTLLIKTK